MSVLNISQIMEILPHRQPMLLIDSVEEIEYGVRAVAKKCVSFNEPFFAGHFPEEPVMPGVLIMEALAQAAGILSFKTEDKKPTQSDVFYFAGIDDARFKRPVMPGDQLHLHVEIERQMRGVWKFKGEARVDGQLAAEARLMCAKRDL